MSWKIVLFINKFKIVIYIILVIYVQKIQIITYDVKYYFQYIICNTRTFQYNNIRRYEIYKKKLLHSFHPPIFNTHFGIRKKKYIFNIQ